MQESQAHDWWQDLYDDLVAELFLVRRDQSELTATASFLWEKLELAEGATLFDQCCGVGSLAIPLARLGCRVVGVDQSESYVARARQDSADLPGCSFHAGDAITWSPGIICDAAFNWGSGFGNADDGRNSAMLRRVFETLRPGGLFALDYQHVPRVLRQFREHMVRRHPLEGGELVLLRESRVDLAAGVLEQTWLFLLPDGRRQQRSSALRLYMPDALAEMLRGAGFVDVKLLGGVRGEALDLDSPRCLALGRKPT